MSVATAEMRRRRRRRLLAPLLLAAAAAVAVLGHTTRGVGDEAGTTPTAQPWLGVVDQGGTLLDASAGEAAGEVWSVGHGRILRYTDAGGWTAVDPPLDADGKPIDHLDPAGGPLQGRATRDGAVALLANDTLLVRDPGGRFHAAPPADQLAPGNALPSSTTPSSTGTPASTSTSTPSSTSTPGSTSTAGSTTTPPTTAEAPLHNGEKLYSTGAALVAAFAQDGHAGAFVVPTAGDDGDRDAVLRFDGTAWSRERICLGAAPGCTTPGGTFAVSAIDAAGAGNAWLLATGAKTDAGVDAGVMLLHRVTEGDDHVWRPVSLGGSPFANRLFDTGDGKTATIAPRTGGQPLVVTAHGVWADATITRGSSKPEDATLFYDADGHAVGDVWCDDANATLCTRSLGSDLPANGGRSFVWDDGSRYGVRLVTGLEQGAMLRFAGTSFTRVPTAGGGVGADDGAAFAAPDDGWFGSLFAPIRYGGAPEPNRLRQWPVPFRHPLTAIAAEPGKPVGAIDAQALAVGDQGEVARYVPGQGWSPESLIGPTGARVFPRLRGVAWPTPDRAYAVGDKAEMWLWRRATGLWESDPGKPPNVATANFTDIAFDPGNPDRGYAIGKQGVLMRFDRQWTQEPLPDGLGDANFTSIAFAGHEAIVAYKTPVRTQVDAGYIGGIIVNDGSGWRKDTSIADQLPPLGSPSRNAIASSVLNQDSVPERVAGLPDGSAVVATMDGHLAERDGASGAWKATGLEAVGFPAALSAFHENGVLRALISVEPTFDGGALLRTDIDTIINPVPSGQAPILLDPYPLPTSGYVLRQTDDGWHDEQHLAWPGVNGGLDRAEHPDPVLALLTDPFGRAGWAVGGDSDVQTASVARYPDDGQAAPGAASAPMAIDASQATFAVGGGAACKGGCADLEPVGVAPWRWLPAAVSRAAQIGGVRAFLDTGPGTAGPKATDDFPHEQRAAAQRLTDAAGELPVYTAAGPSDRDAAGSLGTFLSAFGSASTPLGSAAAPGIGNGVGPDAASNHGYYAFDSNATADGAGTVRVVVLDLSGSGVGDDQRCWLAQQLSGAATQSMPAIVVGARAIAASELGDADAVAATLAAGTEPPGCLMPGPRAAASAYFYDLPEANKRTTIVSGDKSIFAFGTGSLGYITPPIDYDTAHPPNSGFLLAQVDTDPAKRTDLNVAPVVARLIPNIAELSIDATDGTLLRRSQVALFDGLARRPRAGQACGNGDGCQLVPDPYTPIPFTCVGDGCDSTIPPEYTYKSSDPSVADFVARDPASINPRRALFDAAGDPIPSASSGLLCAYNPGTTTITLTSGGLSYSQKVTVQEGSVRRPCGTVPANRVASKVPAPLPDNTTDPVPEPSGNEPPVGGGGILPPPIVPTPAKAKPHHKPAPPFEAAIPFLPVASGLTQVVAAPPPPGPTAARPAPPSGTASSQVYQSAVAPERQREEEPSVEIASNSMVRYEDGPLPQIVSRGGAVLLLVLAGFALTDLRPRPRRRPAFISNNNDDNRRDPRTPR